MKIKYVTDNNTIYSHLFYIVIVWNEKYWVIARRASIDCFEKLKSCSSFRSNNKGSLVDLRYTVYCYFWTSSDRGWKYRMSDGCYCCVWFNPSDLYTRQERGRSCFYWGGTFSRGSFDNGGVVATAFGCFISGGSANGVRDSAVFVFVPMFRQIISTVHCFP